MLFIIVIISYTFFLDGVADPQLGRAIEKL